MADIAAIASMTTVPGSKTAPSSKDNDEARLREAAKRFEQNFIAQMLTESGLTDALLKGGGQGADAFTTFYVDKIAEQIADNGGFGMADVIYERLAHYRDQLDPARDAGNTGERNERSVSL